MARFTEDEAVRVLKDFASQSVDSERTSTVGGDVSSGPDQPPNVYPIRLTAVRLSRYKNCLSVSTTPKVILDFGIALPEEGARVTKKIVYLDDDDKPVKEGEVDFVRSRMKHASVAGYQRANVIIKSMDWVDDLKVSPDDRLVMTLGGDEIVGRIQRRSDESTPSIKPSIKRKRVMMEVGHSAGTVELGHLEELRHLLRRANVPRETACICRYTFSALPRADQECIMKEIADCIECDMLDLARKWALKLV